MAKTSEKNYKMFVNGKFNTKMPRYYNTCTGYTIPDFNQQGKGTKRFMNTVNQPKNFYYGID